MSFKIVILAAGSGTRMKSEIPKVLHKISGKEMIYLVTKQAKKLTSNIDIILFYKHELIQNRLKNYFDDINIILQDHTNYPGTGGAMMGVSLDSDKIMVLNGDMPLIEASELSGFLDIDASIIMSVIELENPSGYGRVIIENGEVLKIVEEKDATDDIKKIRYVNAGVYLFKSEILREYLPKLTNANAQKEYYLTDIIEMAKRDGKIIKPIFVKEENFKGVNSKLDLAKAEEIMQNRIKENFMKNGITMRLPNTIYIEAEVSIKGDCIIENGVSIMGKSEIVNSHIKTNSIIEDSVIIDSDIGPVARVRPNSVIKNSHIGNFVEIKKSNLNGVKAGHLSYLGDSDIDEGTNIGAGTITCNYDGKNKYQTKIGKNVFIGSDTQIVAPCVIEDNVIVGAGTTVTKDIKSGDLAISRVTQTNISGFFYKFFNK